MNEISTDMTMWLVFIAVGVVSLFFTGLYLIIRAYSSNQTQNKLDKKGEKTNLSLNQDSRPKASDVLKISVDVNKVSLKEALSNSRKNFWQHLRFSNTDDIDQILEQIEEALYLGDVGPQTVTYLVNKSQQHFSNQKLSEDSLRQFLKKEMSEIFGSDERDKSVYSQLSQGAKSEGPIILMVVGVNGVGKTTTIGKLAQNLAEEGKKVLIAAGDTFRAAAGEQLKVWTERAQAEIYFSENIKDPSAVAYDAVSKAQNQNFDVCIIDTAGRLHTQSNLMSELEKVKRVVAKVIEGAPQHIWIVLDANSGQNALYQAKSFDNVLNLTGVVLTKLDGTAKGGMALAVANELKVPIRFIGVGEKAQDLRPFIQKEFVDSLI